ncbi:MAG: 3-isopropylmalate dehydratase small subunit [bacterium]
MKIKGKVWKYGRDVNTDEIIPARYLYTADPKELAAHCMEDFDAGFLDKINPGDIIVAEENFGCGSSREHAPIALKEAGIACVIAKSFARIFYRNAINIGLPIFEAPEAVEGSSEGDMIEVAAAQGIITNRTKGCVFQAAPFPDFMREIIAAGGLINYVREKVKAGA